MRVAIVGPCHPHRGGIAQHNAWCATTLIEAGHDARVFGYTRLYPEVFFPGKTQMDTSRVSIAAPTERCFDSIRPDTWVRGVRAVVAWKPDLVVLSHWHPFFAPMLLSVTLGVRATAPVVLDAHNILPHESFPGASVLVRALLGRCSTLIVHSRAEAARARELGGPPAQELALASPRFRSAGAEGADARAALGVPEDADVVLFFGLIRAYKGVSDLLHAVAGCDRPVHLILAGECYEPEAGYRDLIHSLGITDRVTADLRFIPNEEVALFFRAADLVALPYRDATQSGVLAIAREFGKPVVVTDVGGLPELVEAGVDGFVSPAGSPSALAAEIDSYFELSATQREEMALASAGRAQQSEVKKRWIEIVEATRR